MVHLETVSDINTPVDDTIEWNLMGYDQNAFTQALIQDRT